MEGEKRLVNDVRQVSEEIVKQVAVNDGGEYQRELAFLCEERMTLRTVSKRRSESVCESEEDESG